MSIDIEQLLNRADFMIATHNYDNAIKLYDQIIAANENCEEAYLMRGELYGALGKAERAFEDVLKAISIDATYHEAYLALAILYKRHGDLEKSIEVNLQAIKLNNNVKYVRNIAHSYEILADKDLSEHKPKAAISHYQCALNFAPDNINLIYKLAFTLSKSGDFKESLELAESILTNNSKHVPTRCLLAEIYEKIGDIDSGWEIVNSLVHEYPNNPHINIIFGKYALRLKRQDDAIKKLSTILQRSDLKIDDQLSINMLLGKIYDSIPIYDKAFVSFKNANALVYNDYDVNLFEQQISCLINYFSANKYSSLPGSSNNHTTPVFILGMPRSGTSLVEQIVSSHSEAYGGGELQYIPGLINSIQTRYQGDEYPYVLDRITVHDLDEYADKHFNMMQELSLDSSIITDKLPHNFLFIALIRKLFPKAKIINCLRNPIDTCLSCYFQHFGGYHPYAYSLSDLGRYYRQYSRLMNHWVDTLDIEMLTVQYESLVRNTKNEVSRILEYLELAWEDQCLEFYRQNRPINTSSYTQVDRNIYTDSVNRWKNYKPYIGELIDSLEISSDNIF